MKRIVILSAAIFCVGGLTNAGAAAPSMDLSHHHHHHHHHHHAHHHHGHHKHTESVKPGTPGDKPAAEKPEGEKQ